jgi:hypothetical protein
MRIVSESGGHCAGMGGSVRGHIGRWPEKERYMKFRPLHDRIVIKRLEVEARTATGIIFPDIAKEKPQQGEVVAVGPGGRDA